MKLPCARHLANHLAVQELALAAALTATEADASLLGVRSSDVLYQDARRVARLPWAVEEQVHHRHYPGTPRLNIRPAVWQRLLRHLPSSSSSPPAAHIARYGPRVPLPGLPKRLHDDVGYDEAVHHAALLQRLLQTYGVTVQLSGATRRGAPLGRLAEFSLALTEDPALENQREALFCVPDPHQRGRGERVKHDSFVLPRRIVAGGEGGDGDAPLLDRATQELLQQLPFQWCSDSEAASSTDFVPPTVKFRYARALQGLFRSGYVAAGCMPTAQQWHEKCQCTKIFTLRYDPCNPTEVPPFHIRDAAVRERIKLHQVVLDIMPWDALHVRRFFRTGPGAFTAHATLRALQRGMELNLNGIFLCASQKKKEGSDSNGSDFDAESDRSLSMNRKRLLVQSERDIFQLVGLPYIDPLARAIYCQRNSITLTDTD